MEERIIELEKKVAELESRLATDEKMKKIVSKIVVELFTAEEASVCLAP